MATEPGGRVQRGTHPQAGPDGRAVYDAARTADDEIVQGEIVQGEMVQGEVIQAEVVQAEMVSEPVRGFASSSPGPFRMAGASARLEVRLEFFPLGWMFFFCTPVVVVNGQMHRLGWGCYDFDLPPGRYHVRIYVPYLFWPECGANEVLVDLPPATYCSVRFYMWPWVYAQGSLTVS